jgi:hypothetical protein
MSREFRNRADYGGWSSNPSAPTSDFCFGLAACGPNTPIDSLFRFVVCTTARKPNSSLSIDHERRYCRQGLITT